MAPALVTASMEASASQSPLLMRRESPRTGEPSKQRAAALVLCSWGDADLESPRRKGDLRDSNQMRTARFSSDAIPGLNTDSPLLRHKSDTTAQNSPRRKDSADVPPRRHPSGERRGSMENGNDSTTFNTPPSKPGDVSPVFARKDKEAVHVPRNMQVRMGDSRVIVTDSQSKQADSRIRCLKDFQLHALIGRGGFGSVFLATEHATVRDVLSFAVALCERGSLTLFAGPCCGGQAHGEANACEDLQRYRVSFVGALNHLTFRARQWNKSRWK